MVVLFTIGYFCFYTASCLFSVLNNCLFFPLFQLAVLFIFIIWILILSLIIIAKNLTHINFRDYIFHPHYLTVSL